MVDRHSGCPIPDGRELKSEIQKDRSKTLNYVNLGTGIRVNSVEDMFRYKDRESGENTPKQFSDWRPHQSRPSILQSVQGSWPQYLPLPLSSNTKMGHFYRLLQVMCAFSYLLLFLLETCSNKRQ